MNALRSEQDLCHRILPIRSQPYPPTDQLPHRLIVVARAMFMAVVDGRAQYHRLPSPAREGTATPLSLHHPTPRGQDTARDPEIGATTETPDDDVGKAVRRSVVDTEILANTAAETDEVRVWIRAGLRKNGVQ